MFSITYPVLSVLVFSAFQGLQAMEKTQTNIKQAEGLQRLTENAKNLRDVPALCRLARIFLVNDLPQAVELAKKAFESNPECAASEFHTLHQLVAKSDPLLAQRIVQLEEACKGGTGTPVNGTINTILLEAATRRGDIIEQTEVIKKLLTSLSASERIRVVDLILKKFLSLMPTDPETLFIPFLKWCTYSNSPWQYLKEFCASASHSTFLLDPLSRKLFALLKQCALRDSHCGHEIALLLARHTTDKGQACWLWRTIEHPVAPWGLILYDAQLQQKGQFCKILEKAIEQIALLDRMALSADSKELIIKALARAETLAQTAPEYLMLATFYAQTPRNLGESDSKKAQLYYEKAYEIMIIDKMLPGTSWCGAWEFFIDRLCDETQKFPHASLIEDALICLLENRTFKKNDSDAAVLLTKFYAYGRKKRAADILKLKDALPKISPLLDDPEKLRSFFERTTILDFLKNGQHVEVHADIVMMNLALAVSENDYMKENERANYCIEILVALLASKEGCKRLYTNEVFNHVFLCGFAMLTAKVCSLFTLYLMEEYKNECCKNNPDQKIVSELSGKLEFALFNLNRLLLRRIDYLIPPFFQDNYSEGLKALIDALFTQSYQLQKDLYPKRLEKAIKLCQALMNLLGNRGYMSEDFIKGCALLASANDGMSLGVLKSMLLKTEEHLMSIENREGDTT